MKIKIQRENIGYMWRTLVTRPDLRARAAKSQGEFESQALPFVYTYPDFCGISQADQSILLIAT
jgi:hypothetical protein